MDQGPPKIPTLEQEPILTFEEFSSRKSSGYPRYNNFCLYFNSADQKMAKLFEEKEHYIRFKSENSNLASLLRENVTHAVKIAFPNGRDNRSKTLESCDKDLYKAYVIMRGYGVSDKDLFS